MITPAPTPAIGTFATWPDWKIPHTWTRRYLRPTLDRLTRHVPALRSARSWPPTGAPLTAHYGPIKHVFPNLTDPPFVLRDLVMYPTGPNQTAIDLRWPADVESSPNVACILENVHCVPGNGYFWLDNIYLENAWNAMLMRLDIVGPAGMPDPVSMNAVTLAGKSTGASIISLRASGVVTGIYVRGEAEGTKVLDADLVGVQNGIVCWPESGGGEPGLWIGQSHINATQWGIHMRNRYQVECSDLLIYGGDYYQTTFEYPFYAIVAERGDELSFNNVVVSSAGTLPNKPIVLKTYTECGAGIFGEPRMAADWIALNPSRT